MDYYFKLHNVDYISCLKKIDRVKDIELYKFIEKLIYNEHPKEIEKICREKFKTQTEDEFINFIKQKTIKKIKKDSTIKRKNIKENMLENYVIRNNKDKKFLQELNLKIFLKTIPNKNIIIEDGDIVDIIL